MNPETIEMTLNGSELHYLHFKCVIIIYNAIFLNKQTKDHILDCIRCLNVDFCHKMTKN